MPSIMVKVMFDLKIKKNTVVQNVVSYLFFAETLFVLVVSTSKKCSLKISLLKSY